MTGSCQALSLPLDPRGRKQFEFAQGGFVSAVGLRRDIISILKHSTYSTRSTRDEITENKLMVS